MSPASLPLSPMSCRWCAMPKGGTVTFEIEPRAVLEAAGWLLKRDPYAPDKQSIVIAALDPEDRKRREAEHWQRVSDATTLLIGWLRRRNRIGAPDKRANLCLPREIANWLAGFERPRASRGGIFGSAARSVPRTDSMPVPAELFFLRCRLASTKRMGRPRLTPDQAGKRLAIDTEMADSSFYRLAARRDGGDLAKLSGLLASLVNKNS